ncbi:MAG: methyltransferase domain-containing protein [Spirochaetales bacterium]|nr:methyltransferase domain-containing protein [Spirochaetales bacterium]
MSGRRERPQAQPGALLALQRGLTGDRALAGSAYMNDPAMLDAYAGYYLEVSRAQVRRIAALAGLRPTSVLDLGSGPGSVSIACAEIGASVFTLVDSSTRALESALHSLESAAVVRGTTYTIQTIRANLETPGAIPAGAYDLVAFGHCLNEVGRDDDRLARRLGLVRAAASSLASGGAILVMDPATLAASRDTLALRDELVAEGWRIVGPCTRRGACPALAAGPQQTCHDQARWEMPRSVRIQAERAGLDRDLIKMSWFVCQPPAGEPSIGEPQENSWRGDVYRVVSAPMLNKGGRVRYLLCGPEGRFPFSAPRGNAAAQAAGFFSLERYDALVISSPEIREGGWGFGPDTIITKLDLPAVLSGSKINP